jgi:hypothetical protein
MLLVPWVLSLNYVIDYLARKSENSYVLRGSQKLQPRVLAQHGWLQEHFHFSTATFASSHLGTERFYLWSSFSLQIID